MIMLLFEANWYGSVLTFTKWKKERRQAAKAGDVNIIRIYFIIFKLYALLKANASLYVKLIAPRLTAPLLQSIHLLNVDFQLPKHWSISLT